MNHAPTRRGRTSVALDIVIALGLTGWAVASLVSADESAVMVLAGVTMTLPLLVRRTRPVLAATIMATAMTVQAVLAEPPEQIWLLIAVILASYALGAFERSVPVSLAGLAALGVAVSVGIVLDGTDVLSNIPPTLIIFMAAPWGAGRALHRRERQTQRLTERVDSLEREQELLAREAVVQERTRIARELHDVVAHSLSVIAIQADAAEGALSKDPSRAREPLAAVKSTAREALTEMRHLLGLLRDEGDTPSLQPQPGLRALDGLIEQVRAAGLEVELTVLGEERPLSPGADLSAFRLVQEALTNTLKHAAATRAVVTVQYDDDGVRISVVDDGSRGATSPAPGESGHGLVGMHERVALYGGTLDVGPDPAGGFQVRASLPR